MDSPPDWQMRPPRRKPRTLWGDLAGLWRGFRGLPVAAQLVIGAVGAIVFIGVASVVLRTGSGDEVSSTGRTTTTTRPASRTITTVGLTTTTVALPAGDDVLLKTVLDGDSFETVDGKKIRLIGIDAPDIETSDCYSTEATSHLRQMIETARGLRLVYDTTKTDRFNRTLAYVYRLPDGLFVNATLVKEGFARASTSTNTAHQTEIVAAENEARVANRGLWQACASTTTTARAATTTTAASSGSTTSTSVAAASTTTVTPSTTTTTVPTSPSTITVAGPVLEGSACAPPGAVSYFVDGVTAVCGRALSDQPYLWRKI